MLPLRCRAARGVRQALPTVHPHRMCSRRFSNLLQHTRSVANPSRRPRIHTRRTTPTRPPRALRRCYSEKSSADALIESIQDQYAVARDEFEIATEETENESACAQADRDAAREELNKLKKMYDEALEGEDGEEIRMRVGNRIRELDHAVQALEELAKAGD
ncbi:hypothetical protein QTJ16_002405 [Diplocarpon rosae]|uniref:Uncharacterized protein n=1 Tax=Diplocarpon rosae TaxID=946125 RepID=A0AAD9T392_9HELO|nr:hypothetical protein QTJ16_002405 [Diplocarpon rosae]